MSVLAFSSRNGWGLRTSGLSRVRRASWWAVPREVLEGGKGGGRGVQEGG